MCKTLRLGEFKGIIRYRILTFQSVYQKLFNYYLTCCEFFSIRKCLDSERARSSNLEQALKHERLNVDSREREVEKKSELLQELTNREHETIKDLEKEVLLGKIRNPYNRMI